MDILAVKLITLITFFACTDCGKTGCSLTLVSKQIHYASCPTHFYPISFINSPFQIKKCLACYNNVHTCSTNYVPHVLHLCPSFFDKGLETAPPPMALFTPSSSPLTSQAAFMASFQLCAQHWNSAQTNMDTYYTRIIPELICAVAPDLQSLALIQVQWWSASIVCCQFPCLTELTLAGGYPSFLPFSFVLSNCLLYPALGRLHHIVSLVNKDVNYLQWAWHTPNLTHLHVSHMGYYPQITMDTLEQIMSKSSNKLPTL